LAAGCAVPSATTASILQQNTGKQAAVVKLLCAARGKHGDSLIAIMSARRSGTSVGLAGKRHKSADQRTPMLQNPCHLFVQEFHAFEVALANGVNLAAG
jgi:hypothetical protein